jgi:hypothetical protein
MMTHCLLVLMVSFALGFQTPQRLPVHGRVVEREGQSADPVAGATVSVAGMPGTATTSSEGRFTLLMAPTVSPGDEIRLTVQKPGFAVYTSDIIAAEVLDKDIVLVPLKPVSSPRGVLPPMSAELSFLVQKLKDTNQAERLNAISELSKKGAAARVAAPYLADSILADTTGATCNQASEAIIQVGITDPAVVDKLYDALRNATQVPSRVAAVKALGAAGPLADKYLPDLKIALRDEIAILQNGVAEAILGISRGAEPEAVAVIENNFAGPSPLLHAEAAKTLAVIPPRYPELSDWAATQLGMPVSDDSPERDTLLLKLLVGCGPSVRPSILRAISSYSLGFQFHLLKEWLDLDSTARSTAVTFYSSEWLRPTIDASNFGDSILGAQWLVGEAPGTALQCGKAIYGALNGLSGMDDAAVTLRRNALDFLQSLDSDSLAKIFDDPAQGANVNTFFETVIIENRDTKSLPTKDLKAIVIPHLRAAIATADKNNNLPSLNWSLMFIIRWQGRIDNDLVPFVIKSLGNDQQQNWVLLNTLKTVPINDALLPALIKGLGAQSSSEMAVAYIKMIGSLGPDGRTAAPILAPLLANNLDEMSSAAEEALVKIGAGVYPALLYYAFYNVPLDSTLRNKYYTKLHQILDKVAPDSMIIINSLQNDKEIAADYSARLLICGDSSYLKQGVNALLNRDKKDAYYRQLTMLDYIGAFKDLGAASQPAIPWLESITGQEHWVTDEIKSAVRSIQQGATATCLRQIIFK